MRKKQVLLVLLAGIFVLFSSMVTADQDTFSESENRQAMRSYNALVQIDGKSTPEVYAEFLSQGVPYRILSEANVRGDDVVSQRSTSSLRSEEPNIRTNPMFCVPGQTGVANFEVSGSTLISSFISSTGNFNKSAVCVPFPVGSGCSYIHIAGGADPTTIVAHEGFGLGMAYTNFTKRATCGALFG